MAVFSFCCDFVGATTYSPLLLYRLSILCVFSFALAAFPFPVDLRTPDARPLNSYHFSPSFARRSVRCRPLPPTSPFFFCLFYSIFLLVLALISLRFTSFAFPLFSRALLASIFPLFFTSCLLSSCYCAFASSFTPLSLPCALALLFILPLHAPFHRHFFSSVIFDALLRMLSTVSYFFLSFSWLTLSFTKLFP